MINEAKELISFAGEVCQSEMKKELQKLPLESENQEPML
jgi:hypothetical protein